MEEREIRVTCPVDDAEAIVSITTSGAFHCSHQESVSSCPTSCSARAVLCNPEKSTRMKIVCPSDQQFVRVVVKEGEVTWCSHEHEMPACKRDCLGCSGPFKKPEEG